MMLATFSPHGMQAAARPPGATGLGGSASLERVIERLEEIVDEETAALRSRTAIDLKDFNNRKSQGLLELNRALRGLDGPALSQAASTRLARLRAKLEVNRAALETHLSAVREVASVLAEAIRDAESDGTYSPSIRIGGASYD
jgi:hypothetical protein